MYYQGAPLVASAAGALIENGTAKYSANQISDSIVFVILRAVLLFARKPVEGFIRLIHLTWSSIICSIMQLLISYIYVYCQCVDRFVMYSSISIEAAL